MDSNVFLIKTLATSLMKELESLDSEDYLALSSDSLDLPRKVREFEIRLIRAALLKTRGNQRRAAVLLGLKVSTLNTKIKSYEIECFKIPRTAKD